MQTVLTYCDYFFSLGRIFCHRLRFALPQVLEFFFVFLPSLLSFYMADFFFRLLSQVGLHIFDKVGFVVRVGLVVYIFGISLLTLMHI